jgi:hypothetical protein
MTPPHRCDGESGTMTDHDHAELMRAVARIDQVRADASAAVGLPSMPTDSPPTSFTAADGNSLSRPKIQRVDSTAVRGAAVAGEHPPENTNVISIIEARARRKL